MKLKTFIERPVLSIVISVAIVLLGCIALVTLPVEQFPSIVPPTVEVMTSYPGANAETVQKSVIVPLEEAINGVENMTYIHSTASSSGDAIQAILFLVPVFFVMFQYIQERVKPVEFLPHPDWEIQSEMEDIRKRKEEKVKKNDK